ncbi:cysteine-rich CWC family protein [Parahaliea aestuarii]|uniref:Cysteine-rich CWC family protein n=1 Tax=Parahaliea aestuarii TaxID=1852021 RepID=A0A5C9A572_9GAMM|nr:cysteine-rich CWC family protein [Parahaliea aestuarii]
MDTSNTAIYCPLCGADNHCAVARGGDIGDCWCASTPIDRAALAAVPPAARGTSCLCPACGRGSETAGNQHCGDRNEG